MYTPEEVNAANKTFQSLRNRFGFSRDAFNAGKILMWDEMRKQLEAKDKEIRELKRWKPVLDILFSSKSSQEQPKEGVISKDEVDAEGLDRYKWKLTAKLYELAEGKIGVIDVLECIDDHIQALTSHTKQGEGFDLEDSFRSFIRENHLSDKWEKYISLIPPQSLDKPIDKKSEAVCENCRGKNKVIEGMCWDCYEIYKGQ